MLGGVSLDLAYGPDNNGSLMQDISMVDNRSSNNYQQQQQKQFQQFQEPNDQQEKSSYIQKDTTHQEQQQYQLNQMLMQQKLKANNNKKKKSKSDDDDEELSFIDKLKLNKNEISKFLTLCAILIIALGYDKFLKLSISKIADKYDFTESQKYYLIFGVPTVLLLIVIYFIAS